MTMFALMIATLLPPLVAAAPYPGWRHTGSLVILTTPDGANLPASARLEAFPLLVRLDRDWFDFSQASAGGSDIRFSSDSGKPLDYQLEHYDAKKGTASFWVRVPVIRGNARQEVRLHWGNPQATSASDGKKVFAADNGFASVLHLDEPMRDELGSLVPKNLGTTLAPGIVGAGRHFARGQGIDCGDHITNFPFSDDPFTSEAWFRAGIAGTTVFYWGRYATRFNGKTGDGNEVSINIGAPASLNWASDGPGGVVSATSPRLGEWTHVAATYEKGASKIYVNGKLTGTRQHRGAMSIVRDIGACLGGMRNSDYRYVGEIDEVRVSRVARSADWISLHHENCKPLQTVIGPVIRTGEDFGVSPSAIQIREGAAATLTARAGGAVKLYWTVEKEGVETVAAVDRFSFTLPATRVIGDTRLKVRFKAVFPEGVQTREIPVTIQEDIPEPLVTLQAPVQWDGRETIEVLPVISNIAALRARDAAGTRITWSVLGGAVIHESKPDRLVLKRSQYTGPITVRASVGNGGAETVATTRIQVTEPAKDPWVRRIPGREERPVSNQFYARDDKNQGTLHYNGVMTEAADSVTLRLLADGKLVQSDTRKPEADKSYAFSFPLKPGLIRYSVEFAITRNGATVVADTVGNLVCGDAYIIQGQSNAEATGPNNGPTVDAETPFSDWIRSYGNQYSGEIRQGWGNAVRTRIWGRPDYGQCQIGAWGMVMATNLVAKYRIPVCILNGAVGGTRIDQHQRNEANPNDPDSIYGRLLTRIQAARLTHGIRGVLWHQGENNQGSSSPTGDYDWKSYQQDFIDLSAAWKRDYPNIRHYYMHQIWPSGCNMGGTPAGDMLLEVQRTLPLLYSNMRIMSTLGIVSESSGRGLCHFDLDGYAQIARLTGPLVEQDSHGFAPDRVLGAPNLKNARYNGPDNSEIVLEFDQPMAWKEAARTWFRLDGVVAPISAGKVSGNSLILQLAAPARAKTISYLSGKDWDGKPDRLLYGANGIAALALAEVPLASGK